MKTHLTYKELECLIEKKISVELNFNLSYYTRESCEVSVTKKVLFKSLTKSVVCSTKVTGEASLRVSYDGDLIATTAIVVVLDKLQSKEELKGVISQDGRNINIDLSVIERLNKALEYVSLQDVYFTPDGVVLETNIKGCGL